MAGEDGTASDSQIVTGGRIPGSPGAPAFLLSGPTPSEIPVLIAVPHAGRDYPEPVIEKMRNPGFAALRLEDRYVDLLAREVAARTGASLLVANAPRAMIDLNRSPEDIDWDMIGGSKNGRVDSYAPGRRARTGLGLIPRRVPGLGELWKRRHDESELSLRIAAIHEPYHACLSRTLAELRGRWGAALLVDLHSMPPLPRRGSHPAAEFVLGDRFGASCHGRLVAAAFSYFGDIGRFAAHNRPYAGGYVLERHSDPAAGLHAMQVEIDRSSYLDSRFAERGEGFESIIDLLAGFVRGMANEVTILGQGSTDSRWAEAAE
ncbi:MAG: N-formylglutamate amidohydrolase [Novosphingobium sp.]|nr:N-formylglutamate amidohydrolase [Novosphingobium sp.]